MGRRLQRRGGATAERPPLPNCCGWAGGRRFEGGHHPHAQRYWIAALHAAHAAGDRAPGANVVNTCPSKRRVSARSVRRPRWPRLHGPVTLGLRSGSPRCSIACGRDPSGTRSAPTDSSIRATDQPPVDRACPTGHRDGTNPATRLPHRRQLPGVLPGRPHPLPHRDRSGSRANDSAGAARLTRCPPSRSCTEAAVTSTTSSSPTVSTAMCRLVPLTRFPASYPR